MIHCILLNLRDFNTIIFNLRKLLNLLLQFRDIISVTLFRSLVTFIASRRSRLGRVVPDEADRLRRCFTVKFRLSSYGLRAIFRDILTDYQRFQRTLGHRCKLEIFSISMLFLSLVFHR